MSLLLSRRAPPSSSKRPSGSSDSFHHALRRMIVLSPELRCSASPFDPGHTERSEGHSCLLSWVLTAALISLGSSGLIKPCSLHCLEAGILSGFVWVLYRRRIKEWAGRIH